MGIKNSPGIEPGTLKFFEDAPHMYLILSPALTILTGSTVYLETTLKKQDEITGKYIFDVFPLRPNDPEDGGIKHSLEQVLATKKPHQLPVLRFDVPDAENLLRERYWYTSNTPILNAKGDIQYIIHHTQEVTDQVLAERRLKDALQAQSGFEAKAGLASRQMEKLLSELPGRISLLRGPEFVFEYINPYYQRQFPDKEIVGKTLIEAFPEVLMSPLVDVLKNVYSTGVTYEGKEVPVYLAKKDNAEPELYYFNFIYQARYDEQGNVIGILSFSYDVTELVKSRKQVEQHKDDLLMLNNELEERVAKRTEQLMNQRDKLNSFFMQAPAGICVLDGPDMVFELVNPGYQKFFPGRPLLGKPLVEGLPELKGTAFIDILNGVYTTGKTFEGHEVAAQLARYADGTIEDRYFNFIYQARHDVDDNIDGILVFAYEVTEIVLNRRREHEADKRFKFMLNAMPQQVWTARPTGELDYVNQVVVNDFGQDMEAITGHGWQEFIHPDDLTECLEKWMAALQTGDEYMVEFRLRFKSGQYIWHLGRAVPMVEDGEIKLWLGTNTNIDLQKTNEQRKDEFLSIASHELKTPLTSIKAFNQLMQRNNDAQKLNNFAQKSADPILRLEKLITDLLDVTKINAGKITYQMQPFSFDKMLADSIEYVQQTTPTHKILLQGSGNVIITGDQFRLEQVVNNFLNNAIKYSPRADKVLVKYFTEGDNLVVSVQDFGIGISAEDVERLFERYFRADSSGMQFEGLGLGLFISSEILKRHHGNFWVESELGKGSTFFFKLPLK